MKDQVVSANSTCSESITPISAEDKPALPLSAIRAALSIIITAAIFAGAMIAAHHLPVSRGVFPSIFFLQSIYLGVVLVFIALYSHGKFADFGFTRGSFRITWRFFAWLLPVIAIGIVGATVARHGASIKLPFGLSKLQSIAFVWIYSSFCEEVLTRGFLQTLLDRFLGKARFKTTILLSGAFFGAMHLLAVHEMGPGVVVFATYLGLIAAYYRQKTSSLLPAMLMHVLFNVCSNAPLFAVQWLR